MCLNTRVAVVIFRQRGEPRDTTKRPLAALAQPTSSPLGYVRIWACVHGMHDLRGVPLRGWKFVPESVLHAEGGVRYFLDTEFIERGSKHPIELISIGIVAEDGREYYAISTDFKPRHASQWVKDNVLALLPERNVTPHLAGTRLFRESQAWRPSTRIATDIRDFVGEETKPEFWGYFCGFDYVVMANILGGMSRWPKGWPYLFYDLRQALDFLGLLNVKQDDGAPHNALDDARWIAKTFKRWRAALGPAELTA